MNKKKKREIRFRKKLNIIKHRKEPFVFEILGNKFVIFSGVFIPSRITEFFLKYMKVNEGEVVLDLGTGCGILGVFAAKNASKLILTDVSPQAVKNARYNVKKFGLDNKIEVRQGDLFEPLKQNEKFDVVIFNPPFDPEKPSDIIEMAMRDHRHKTLTNFFRYVKNYLKLKGRIYLSFSNRGDFQYFKDLLHKHKIKIKILYEIKDSEFRDYIYEFRF